MADSEHIPSPAKRQDLNHDNDQQMHYAMLVLPNTNEQMSIQHEMVQDVYNIMIQSRLRAWPPNQVQSHHDEWALRMLKWALEPHCSIKAPEITFFVTQEPNILFFTKLASTNTCLHQATTDFRIIMT